MYHERFDRQIRSTGWNQEALMRARIGVIGDDDLLASLFILSASALGIQDIILMAPKLDQRLVDAAARLSPEFKLNFLEGFYTHPILEDMFRGCSVLVDLSHFGLADKLLLERSYRSGIPLVRGFTTLEDCQEGFKVFTYFRGREWDEIEQMVCSPNLPAPHFDDAVLDMIVAGMVLQETKNLLMGRPVAEEIIAYRRGCIRSTGPDFPVCIVGAGALGNFVALGLAFLGFRHITVMDPDMIEVTNLNRQILFYEAVGMGKAQILCARLNDLFHTNAVAVQEAYGSSTDMRSFHAVFDCVDNFEARILLSERCKSEKKILISGGTGMDSGQVVNYVPQESPETPAEALGLYAIMDRRSVDSSQRDSTACVRQPLPSVIMTNQIIAGFMLDSFRGILEGRRVENIYYSDKYPWRLTSDMFSQN